MPWKVFGFPFQEGNILTRKSVSVVIPFHNGSRWIERALISVQNQTVRADELIVVDDGSSDEESKFLTDLRKKLDFRILNQPNSGQSAARNFGISEASSEFVCMLDQDDFFLPKNIEVLLNAVDFEDPKFGFSYGDLWRVNESDQVLAHSCINIETQHPHVELKTMIKNNMFILPSATLIKREAFLSVGGFDPELRGYEDDDLFIRMFVSGFTNRFTPEAVTVWTVNTSSTSFSESMNRSRFIYFKKLIDLFPEGSIVGTNVFGDLMHPRFSLQFADGVIASAFSNGKHFEERVERLKFYRKVVGKSVELSPSQKLKYRFLTQPLVMFPPNMLRFFLSSLLKSGLILFFPKAKTIGAFVRKYLPRKK
jgi:glycosyltransferase involved in cell wall biosynthesis